MNPDKNGTIRFKIVFEVSDGTGCKAWFEARPDVVADGWCPSKAVDILLEKAHEIYITKQEQEAQ